MFLTLPIDRINSISYLIEQIPNWKNLDAIFVSNLYGFDNNLWTNEEESSNEDSCECLPPLSCGLKQIRFDMWCIEWIELDGWRKHFSTNPLGKSAYISYGNVA